MTGEMNVRPFSAMIDDAIWVALDRRYKAGTETKRVHLERALVTYLEPADFESDEYYQELVKRYGPNQ